MAQQDLTKAFDPARDDVSTVISILPVQVDETKPGLLPGQYIIPGVKNPLEDVEILHVYRARFPVYLDENRPALIVPAPSDTVADSICRDYKVSMPEFEPGVSEPGIFWTRGKISSKMVKEVFLEDLEYARAKQLTWFKRLVAAADDDWGQYHKHRMISSLQRLAADVLKVSKEWNHDAEVARNLSMVPCKFCRADVHPEAIICQYCRGILDIARYEKEYKAAPAV